MFLAVQSESQKTLKGSALAFSLALGIIAAGPAVQAQSTDDGSMGMDLLPPEVVPLDPTAASQLSATQAESRQMSGSEAAPGLVAGDNNSGMQSAQDFRKSAFESLYNQGQLPAQQQPVWRAGQVQYGNGAPAMPVNGMSGMPAGMPGMPGTAMPQHPQTGFAPPGSPQFGQYPSTPGMTNGALYSAHQTQTLSGAPKSKPVVRDVRKGGFSHALSAIAGFGAGAITHGALMNPQSAMMGLGMFGATMTGFGVRNASRF